MKKRIAVIGAGAFGVWTAYFLQSKGVQVSLFDAWGAGNSRASSGGESRIIRGAYGSDRVYVEMVSQAFQLWQEFEQRHALTFYQRTGALWLFSQNDDDYLQSSLPHLKEFGFEVQELSPSEVAKRYPVINPKGLTSAYFEKEAGLLPARLSCEQVAEVFVKLGGTFIQSFVRPGRIVQQEMSEMKLSDGSTFVADEYVFACGPYLPKLFPELLASWLMVSRQEVYFFTVPGGESGYQFPSLPIWLEFGETFYYGLPGRNLRGLKMTDDIRNIPFDPDTDDRLPTPKRLQMARGYLRQRFPKLANAPLQESRVCQYLNDPNGHFIIDRHPEAHNVWIAGAGTGHAFKMGPAIGAYLSDLILEDQLTRKIFSLDRPKEVKRGFNQFNN